MLLKTFLLDSTGAFKNYKNLVLSHVPCMYKLLLENIFFISTTVREYL